MTSINYNEFQAGQGVSAPALNENFTLTSKAIETIENTVNSTLTTVSSNVQLKANRNGSNAEKFNVAQATEDTQAVNLGQLNALLTPLSPTGTVIWFAGSTAPEGYLLCNGSAVSRTTYADLFNVIGVAFGAGNSTTTFNLPNLTDNRFIEGSSSVGTKHNAGLPNITGNIYNSTVNSLGSADGAFARTAWEYGTNESAGGKGNKFDFNASRSSSIYGASTTVQPKSLTLLPCIKY